MRQPFKIVVEDLTLTRRKRTSSGSSGCQKLSSGFLSLTQHQYHFSLSPLALVSQVRVIALSPRSTRSLYPKKFNLILVSVWSLHSELAKTLFYKNYIVDLRKNNLCRGFSQDQRTPHTTLCYLLLCSQNHQQRKIIV